MNNGNFNIHPNTTGAIKNNVVYNTAAGFLVDSASTTFDGNSWGDPPNEYDIILLAGTTFGSPTMILPPSQQPTITPLYSIRDNTV